MLGDEICRKDTNQLSTTSLVFLRLIWFNLKSITRSPGSRDEKHFENFLTSYTQLEPNEQNSFDLFRGSWSTKTFDVQDTGGFDGFNDERINWLLDELGGVQSKKILELGPLEGAHTYMLEGAGGDVLSIEGNHGAFLRCLIVKNFLA